MTITTTAPDVDTETATCDWCPEAGDLKPCGAIICPTHDEDHENACHDMQELIREGGDL